MRKLSNRSLSLASKCLLGFAVAVLLIIGSALYVPYRWMDKLVEQGRLALARSEVQHVLMNHFRPSDTLELSGGVPPLALVDSEHSTITTGHWEREDDGELSHIVSNDSSLPNSEQAFTQWVTLAEIEQRVAELESDEEVEPLSITEAYIQRAAEKFQEDRDRTEMFRTPEITDSSDSWMDAIVGNSPSLYMRAIRADQSCIASGCHGSGGEGGSVPGHPLTLVAGELVGVVAVTVPSGQSRITLIFNRLLIIVAGLLAGICAIVAFYLITQRFILRPVRLLREAADHMRVPAEDSKDDTVEPWQEVLATTQTIRTGDEFEQLAEAFGEMLTRLKLTHDRLRETNRALDLQLGELESRNVALFESNKLKNEFLANVSHELRTPLNAIIGFAEILKERAGDDDKSQRYSGNILESGKLLLALINDLLDLAKIEAGKVEVQWEQCVLVEIAEGLLNLTRLLAEEKHLRINLSVDENLGIVETDAGKLKQVLFNLLSNAIKFTPEGGRIDVIATLIDEDNFELRVSDTGPGIPATELNKIFEKFRQLDGSMTRSHSGTGLGLAIVKELVGVIGGSISVESVEGQGTVFSILLPIKRHVDDDVVTELDT